MRNKHHTNRLAMARRKAIEEWETWVINSTKNKQSVFDRPIQEEYQAFTTGFNIGYKIGRIHERHQKTQSSKWKPVLDALCRVKDPISWKQAMKLLNCTEKALEKHLNNYEYHPTIKDYIYGERMLINIDLDNMRF